MKSSYILFSVLALVGCATTRDLPEELWELSNEPPSLSERGLTWLATMQSTNGYWGVEEETRVLLTSVVVGAFLSHGETPASKTFGPAVRRALRYLVASEVPSEGVHPMVLAPRAALVWVLGEAYSITLIPLIGERFAQVSAEVGIPPTDLSPFSLWAAKHLPKDQATQAQRTILRALQSAESNLLTYACIARAIRDLDHSALWWGPYDQAVIAVLDLHPENWRRADYPMLTLVALCDVFAEASKRDAGIWWKPFWTNAVGTTLGDACWPPTIVGVEESAELQTFRSEHDRTVYTTAMMVNAMNQIYRFPRCRHGDPE